MGVLTKALKLSKFLYRLYPIFCSAAQQPQQESVRRFFANNVSASGAPADPQLSTEDSSDSSSGKRFTVSFTLS